MQLRWNDTTSDGNCPILGYDLFIDDGTSGVASINATSTLVYDNPNARTADVTMSAANLGKTFTYKLRVRNREGFVESD